MKKHKIFYIRESALQSTIADIDTFGSLLGCLTFNHKVLGGKWYLDLVFVWMIIVATTARTSKTIKRFKTIKELKKYLTNTLKD